MSDTTANEALQAGGGPGDVGAADAAPQDPMPKNAETGAQVDVASDVSSDVSSNVPSGEMFDMASDVPSSDALASDAMAADATASDAMASSAAQDISTFAASAPDAMPAGATGDGAQSAPPVPRGKTPARRRARRATHWLGIAWGAFLGSLCLSCFLMGGNLIRRFNSTPRPDFSLPPANSGQPAQDSAVEPGNDNTRLQVYDIPDEANGYTTQYIVEQVQDSVVGILLYDGSGLEPVGAGTGIIMSEEGHIITNAHVVVDTTGLTVVLSDESKYTAIVLGYDEKTDLAVIKINATGLHPAEFGNSDQVVVGERAIAIGNPGGLAGSVSQGVISGINREIVIQLSDGSNAVLTALQTDAAINPGNSGGPLLNAYGQVVGINSSKIVRNGYEGIGFAIPVNEAQPVIDNLIHYGYVKDRAILGITIYALDATNGPANGLPSQGLYIASIEPYSDLVNHGIMPGDVILKANGVEMLSNDDLAAQLKLFRPGDTMSMEILRTYDGSVVTVDVLLLDARAGQTAPTP